ncbi:restriction endonuclease subunit S [Salmonella enterica subsp. enterica serovar Sarajane]|nr:restriction endonuclease subunit S [Salmonella enterica subsp. enterica serovar Sarajane]
MEKLLDGVEVEWKALGDVTKKIYSGGTPDTKKTEYWEGGTFPWMSSGEVNLKTVKETEKYITEAGLNNSSAKLVPKNSVVMALAGQGKTRGKVARTRIALTTNQSLAALTFDEKKINSDYIFHFLETQYESLRQISSGNSGRGGLNLQMISAYKVPVPCPDNPEKSLAIQAEIVRILDIFTALTNELTNELKLRQKQYNYYREQLLSFEDGSTKSAYLEKLLDGVEVKWLPLGDLGKLVRGNGLQKKDFTDTGVPAIHYGQIYTYYGLFTTKTCSFVSPELAKSLKQVNKGDVIITNTSENFEGVGKCLVYLGERQAVTGGHATVFKPGKLISTKYFAYFTQVDSFAKSKRKYSKGTKVIDVSTADMSKILIPIPCPDNPEKSLAIQSEIVRILDKFDTLTSSISEGLPREIALRKKQYEHYRSLLFSFPKPVADN